MADEPASAKTRPVPLMVRLPPHLHEALRDEAERQDRSLNNLIVRLVREGLERATDQPK